MLAQMALRWLPLAVAAPFLGGCLELCYVGQAAAGQEDIGFRSRPIEEALADPTLGVETRSMLALIGDVKNYGESHGLTATESYRSFANLERSAVVWVVTASQPLRFEAVTWRFPIVGAVPYLGWFDRSDAGRHASELSAAGLDVYVREARAYSTLGWFQDPVLSTMLQDGPEDLVEVVLHESMHATHFVASQTVYNESLANFVGSRMSAQYLREKRHGDAWQAFDNREREHEHEHRIKRLAETHAQLGALYASTLPDEEKLAQKQKTLAAVKAELGLVRTLNNATLLQAQTYNSGAVGFSVLFEACGENWQRFIQLVRTIGPAAFHEPDQRAIDPLLLNRARAGCPPG